MKVSGRKEFPLKGGEDNLRLVQPGGVDWEPMDLNSEGKMKALNPTLNLLGGMGGAVIQNQMKDLNAFRPEAGEYHQEEPLEINETLAFQKADHGFSAVNQKRGKKVGDALPQITGADANSMPVARRRDASGIAQCLDAGLLIGADNRLSPLDQRLGLLVEIQNHGGSFQESWVGRFLPGLMLPGFYFLLAKPLSDGGWGDA